MTSSRRSETPNLSKIEVEQNNVGLLADSEGKGLAAVSRLANYVQSRPAFNQHVQRCAHERVIVYEQDADRLLAWHRHDKAPATLEFRR